MEAVLCSKKRTDNYLWVINEVYVQTLRSLYFHEYQLSWCHFRHILSGIKRASLMSKSKASIVAVFETFVI